MVFRDLVLRKYCKCASHASTIIMWAGTLPWKGILKHKRYFAFKWNHTDSITGLHSLEEMEQSLNSKMQKIRCKNSQVLLPWVVWPASSSVFIYWLVSTGYVFCWSFKIHLSCERARRVVMSLQYIVSRVRWCVSRSRGGETGVAVFTPDQTLWPNKPARKHSSSTRYLDTTKGRFR